MESAESEQNELIPEESRKDLVDLTLRAPLFSYLANCLAPVYKKELAQLQQDGSFIGIKEFHHGPFGTLMGQILDTATAQQENELPKVTMSVSEEQMQAAKERMKVPSDAVGQMLYSQMMGEFTDEYRSAKMSKKIAGAKGRIKAFFKR